MTLDQAVKIATGRILPPGYKPEDYLMVDDKVPFRIATLIVREALHIMDIAKRKGAR